MREFDVEPNLRIWGRMAEAIPMVVMPDSHPHLADGEHAPDWGCQRRSRSILAMGTLLLMAGCGTALPPASPEPSREAISLPFDGAVAAPAPGWEALQRELPGTVPVPPDARVTLQCERQDWILGETCILRLVVENVGTTRFQIYVGGDDRGVNRRVSPEVHAIDEEGREAPDPGVVGMWMGGLSSRPGLNPGDRWIVEVALPLYRRIDRPGSWTIRVRNGFGWKDTPGRPVPSPEIRLHFRYPTDEEAREILEKNLAAQPEAARQMGLADLPWCEPSALAIPLYFPLVEERARQGNPRAIEAATWFPTPEATRLVIECLPLLQGSEFKRIAQSLGIRLPVPPGSSFHPFLGEGGKPTLPWDSTLEGPLRSWALQEQSGEDPWRKRFAERVLECLPPR